MGVDASFCTLLQPLGQARACLLALLLSATPALAQQDATPAATADASEAVNPPAEELDLRRLIFDPVLLAPEAIGVVDAVADGTGSAARAGIGADAAGDADAASLRSDISAYQARIADLRAVETPYSQTLREQYDALGTLLQRSGQHEEAIAAFESALQIDRISDGLWTLNQIPLVEKIIDSHAMLGHLDELNDFHGYLFYIQQKSFAAGDPRLLAAKEDWADWNLQSYLNEAVTLRHYDNLYVSSAASMSRNDYVAIQNRDGSFSYVPRNQMSMLGASGLRGSGTASDLALRGSLYAVQADQVIDERLRTAREMYEEVLDASTADAGTSNDDERVQHKLAAIAYAISEQLSSMDSVQDENSVYANRVIQPRSTPPVVTRSYTRNRDALEAMAQELEADANATAEQKALAWINVGDWHVGFDSASRAQAPYRKAWDILAGAGLDASAIEAVFHPQPLVPAPGFVPHDFSRSIHGVPQDADLPYKGFIDLTLTLSRFGDVRGTDAKGETDGTPYKVRALLLEYLRKQKMRPFVVDGATVTREDIAVRYYYVY